MQSARIGVYLIASTETILVEKKTIALADRINFENGFNGERKYSTQKHVALVDLNSFSSIIYFVLLFDILLAPLDNL